MEFWIMVTMSLATIVLNLGISWYTSYVQKNGEYQSLKENLNGVIKAQEQMKRDLDVISDERKHLATETRLALFRLHEVHQVLYKKIAGFGYLIDDSTKELEEIHNSMEELLAADSRVTLLIPPSANLIANQKAFNNALTTYRIEKTNLVANARKNRDTIDQQVYSEQLSAITTKHVENITSASFEFTKSIKQLLFKQAV